MYVAELVSAISSDEYLLLSVGNAYPDFAPSRQQSRLRPEYSIIQRIVLLPRNRPLRSS